MPNYDKLINKVIERDTIESFKKFIKARGQKRAIELCNSLRPQGYKNYMCQAMFKAIKELEN